MKPSEIKNLIDFIAKSGLNEVNIETEQFKISVKKDAEISKVIEHHVPSVAPVQPVAAVPTSAPQAQAAAPATPAPAAEASDKYVKVTSPMIGTFYKSASPDSPAFVSVGDSVTVGKTVCIVEAMKLFNEIESDVSGRIVEILVEDSTPVEYGTPLFLVDPS